MRAGLLSQATGRLLGGQHPGWCWRRLRWGPSAGSLSLWPSLWASLEAPYPWARPAAIPQSLPAGGSQEGLPWAHLMMSCMEGGLGESSGRVPTPFPRTLFTHPSLVHSSRHKADGPCLPEMNNSGRRDESGGQTRLSLQLGPCDASLSCPCPSPITVHPGPPHSGGSVPTCPSGQP